MSPVELPPPDALRARVERAISETSPDRLGRGARSGIAAVTALVILAIGLVLLRDDFAQLPASQLAGITLGVTLLAAATLLVVLSPGTRGLGPSVTTLVGLTVVTAPLYAALTVISPLGATASPRTTSCFAAASLCALLALTGFTVALRRAVPVAPIARGALLGAAAGAWAGLTQHLHCPSGARLHILLGHAVPIVIFAIVGALVTPRWLRP